MPLASHILDLGCDIYDLLNSRVLHFPKTLLRPSFDHVVFLLPPLLLLSRLVRWFEPLSSIAVEVAQGRLPTAWRESGCMEMCMKIGLEMGLIFWVAIIARVALHGIRVWFWFVSSSVNKGGR